MMGHLRDDRTVLAAAPRIERLPGIGSGAWFEQRLCALDLGGVPADVDVGNAVSYIQSAALLVDDEAFRRDESMAVR